jgi:hypothetical protein
MSYEFNSESKKLDVPNPYRVENYFRFIAAGLLFVGSGTLLFLGREGIAEHVTVGTILPILLGIVLMVIGINYAARAASQLRFYFGRGKPQGLAPELSVDQVGDSDRAKGLKETMRQNAITFEEPVGALNGILYSWIPDLIFAPKPIQIVAQRQFQTALTMLITLISFLVTWIGFPSGTSTAWLGMFFFLFTATLLIKPLEAGVGTKVNLGMKGLIGLVLVAVLGPVLVPMVAGKLPDISWLSTNLQTLLMLITSMGAVFIFFVALTKQSFAPPNTTMACEQAALSMNSAPKQLVDEIDRLQQTRWVEQIPNRRYTKIDPDTSGNSGAFAGEFLEESQPMPREDLRRLDFSTSFSEARYKWLSYLNVLGIVMILLATGFLVTFGALLKPHGLELTLIHYVTIGLSFLLVGGFCIKSGHFLWGRFDFVSEVVWIELKGNYQSAKLDYGNSLTDKVRTQKQLINIESMTLRVWVAQLDTVTFGKESQRLVIGIRGLPDTANYIKEHIVKFANDQSIMVAPSAEVDIQKVATLGAINKLGGGAGGEHSVLRAIAAATADSSDTFVCPSCKAATDKDSLFCNRCGTKLNHSSVSTS